jgi:hypothetical protein
MDAAANERKAVQRERVCLALHGLAMEVYGSWDDDFSHMFNYFITLGTANSNIPRAILANNWRCVFA